MSTENETACPVCRAKQAYQTECRRCGADLSLWIKALRSLQVAQQKVAQAARHDEATCNKTLNYLRWLSPTAAHIAQSQCFPSPYSQGDGTEA
jgi:hypothetical protein